MILKFRSFYLIAFLLNGFLSFSQSFDWGLDGYSKNSHGGHYRNIDNSGIDLTVKGLYLDNSNLGWQNVQTGINNFTKGSIVHEYVFIFSEKVDLQFSVFDINQDSLGKCFVDHLKFSGTPIFTQLKDVQNEGTAIIPISEIGGNLTISYYQVDTIIIQHGRAASCNPGFIGITPLLLNQNPLKKDTTHFANILFETDKSRIQEQYKEQIDSLINYLMIQKDYKVLLYGHTDKIGNEIYNFELSTQRVMAVQQALINAGLPPERVSIESYGEVNPINSNQTEKDRAQNRRVEIKVYP